MNLNVELRPHVGKQFVPGLGEVDVEHDQYMIWVVPEGMPALHAGYVAKKPEHVVARTGQVFKTPINWLPVVNQWPAAIIDKLSQSVQAALAEQGEAVDAQLQEAGKTRPVNTSPVLPARSGSISRSVDPADDAGSAENL